MSSKKLWALKSVTDEARSYKSIESYNDKLNTQYVYDQFVANHKQIKEGDWAIIVNKEEILGFARVESIRKEFKEKIRKRCPICKETNFEARKNRIPVYRCNKGHEFDIPEEETVNSTSFIASYENSFVTPNQSLSISSLRPFYANNYNRNMSIQLLSMDFFNSHFKGIPQLLSSGSLDYLSPTEAEIVFSDSESGNYIPNSEDERNKIDRQIKERRGQKKFRDSLVDRYEGICLVTGCKLLDILEAAHIKPYRGENDNHPTNGLLLRSDIHTLFDLNLIGINPRTLEISIHNSALNNGYKMYNGEILKGCSIKRPSIEALEIRWAKFNQSLL